jgi:hypothetical protein
MLIGIESEEETWDWENPGDNKNMLRVCFCSHGPMIFLDKKYDHDFHKTDKRLHQKDPRGKKHLICCPRKRVFGMYKFYPFFIKKKKIKT